jgi:protein associated with RNAse G/E
MKIESKIKFKAVSNHGPICRTYGVAMVVDGDEIGYISGAHRQLVACDDKHYMTSLAPMVHLYKHEAIKIANKINKWASRIMADSKGTVFEEDHISIDQFASFILAKVR